MLYATAKPFDWPIIAYMILAGASAGLAVTGCVAALSRRRNLRAIASEALFLATLFIAAGFPLLILDLEQPQMFVYILYYFNPKSVIAWGARGITLYFVLLTVALFLRQRSGALCRVARSGVLVAVLVLAIFVGLYPGFVLQQATARPLWDQPVLPALFLISGLHMGLAVAALSRQWSAGAPGFEPQPQDPLLHDHIMVRWLDAALIAAQAVLLGSYFALCLQAAPEATYELTRGACGILLWAGVISIGWVIPGLDMIFRGARSSLWWRSVCVLIGGICLRVLIIEGGQGAAAFLGSGR